MSYYQDERHVMVDLTVYTLCYGLPMIAPALYMVFKHRVETPDIARKLSGYFYGTLLGLCLANVVANSLANANLYIHSLAYLAALYVSAILMMMLVCFCLETGIAHTIVGAGFPACVFSYLTCIIQRVLWSAEDNGQRDPYWDDAYENSSAWFAAQCGVVVASVVIGYLLRQRAADSHSKFFLLSIMSWAVVGIFQALDIGAELLSSNTHPGLLLDAVVLVASSAVGVAGYKIHCKRLTAVGEKEGEAAHAIEEAYKGAPMSPAPQTTGSQQIVIVGQQPHTLV